MGLFRISITLVLLLIISGCSTQGYEVQDIVTVDKSSDYIPKLTIDKMRLRSVNWTIRKVDNGYEYILDDENNRYLIHNLQEMNRYINSSDELIEYYIDIINR